jgi:deoxyribonuclease-4
MKIGSHVSNNGVKMLQGSVEEALSYNANCFMVYMGAPQNTFRKKSHEMRIPQMQSLLKENNIDINDVVVHAPYIVNLGQQDPEKHDYAIRFLTEEVKLIDATGAKLMVLHPGAHVGSGSAKGIERIILGINMILANTPNSDVIICLETMAGKGTECGRTTEELASIINQVNNKDQLGVCLDTCHLNDSGYDITNFDTYLDEFDNLIGIDKIKCIHINDSKNEQGAHKDRHANFGLGTLGFDTLINVIYNERLKDIPKILETPYIGDTDDSKERLYPPYKYEIDMIRKKEYNPNFLEDIRKHYQK